MSDVFTHGSIRGESIQGTLFRLLFSEAEVFDYCRASLLCLLLAMAMISIITSRRGCAFQFQGSPSLRYSIPRAFPPAYDNSQFITAFSQSFLSIVRSLDPNVKFYADLKPEWSVWQNGTTEMLFNVTSTGEAVVRTTTTDPSLLERCT